MLKPQSRRRCRPDEPLRLGRAVTTAPVSDGVMLIDERRGHTVHLNATAALMLRALLTGGHDNAVTVVRGRFGVTEDTARHDLDRLLRELTRRRLVRR
ncbi:PqqD family peptide modification chaperone [Prauserella muralis]|nr:PqqD family peptide modification chaperone [Prauserella muralis]TWE11182.1 coenzyme PQQ synthesis protein D (PqqD) [Prauserella muralis]